MFTGIIQATGIVQQTQRNAFGMRLAIDPQGWSERPQDGDSVNVNGACLTFVAADSEPGRRLAFDVIRETLDKTTLGQLRPGSRVNLEPALTAQTPLGGHFVQGHIDGVGKVVGLTRSEQEWRIAIAPPRDLAPAIVPKGSVAIDGVSLTVAATTGRGPAGDFTFEVAIIPTTLRLTTLTDLSEGDPVNLETDMIARTIVHWLEQQLGHQSSQVTVDKLRQAGFL